MKFAIIGGTGAMGGALGAALFEGGHDVTLVDVARPAVEKINAHGLSITSKNGETRMVRVPATLSPLDVGVADVVLVFVKCYHTEAAIKSAAPMLGAETVVLSLQNGWGNAPRIAGIVGQERVLVGVTYHSATLLEAGHIGHSGVGKTILGELSGAISPRLERIAGAFGEAGWEVEASPEIQSRIWGKLALNVCTLPTSALLRFTADELPKHEGTKAVMRSLLEETVAVAKAQDIAMDFDERWEAIISLLEKAVGARSSMLQDVEKNRQTEIDVINGAICHAGARLGIATPVNDTMMSMVKSLEETF